MTEQKGPMQGTAAGEGTVYQAGGNMNFYATPTKATARAMHTLPRSAAAFTGRTKELERLFDSITKAATLGNVIAIHAIDGMAGVGKTAFAVYAGHSLANNFPDGQIFLRLHGYTPGKIPVPPEDALASLLAASGLSPDKIPPEVDARAALWRDQLANKKMLLVLDDAISSEQVEPLLPGSKECLVLITSRRRMAALDGVVALPLDVLSADQAADLFVRVSGRSFTADESRHVAQLVRTCGYLPLAISLLAGRLRHRPAWKVADLVDVLSQTQDRLAELHADDVAVAAAFELSYENLHADQQRLFRRLGLHPGAEFDAYSAAALDDTSFAEASHSLDAVYRDHLIDEPTRGRYQMHDLVREYARQLASESEASDRQRALDRLFDYYQFTTSMAGKYISEGLRRNGLGSIAAPVAVPELSSQADAIAWFEAERSTLLACIEQAAGQRRHERVIDLAAVVAGFIRHSGPWQHAIEVHQLAIASAQAIGDRGGEATALVNFGVISFLIGDYTESDSALARAVAICREISDQPGLARALVQLGTFRRLSGSYAQAHEADTEALDIFRELDDRFGQAYALTELGTLGPMMDNYSGAVEALTMSLVISRELGDGLAEAMARSELGTVLHQIGDYGRATTELTAACEQARELGDGFVEAYSLNELGMVRLLVGDYEASEEASARALEIYGELGSRAGQADALIYLGALHSSTGNQARAEDLLRQALDISRQLGDPSGQARALTRLGNAQYLAGNYEEARETLMAALAIFERLGQRRGRAEVSNSQGELLLLLGQAEEARARHEAALRLAKDSESSLEAARAMEGAGRCALMLGDSAADALFKQALAIYQRLGSPQAESVAELLATGAPGDTPDAPAAESAGSADT